MSGAIKNITIEDSPFRPAMEVAFGIALMVRGPRSKRSVTVMVNPAVQDYQAHPVDTPAVQVRQAAVMSDTDETHELFFDFDGATTHKIVVRSQGYEIRLMNIGHVHLDGQDFPRYDFMVSRV